MDRTVFANFKNSIESLTPMQEKQLRKHFKYESDEFALLMLEKPWDSPKDNSKRASMLPFIQGIEKRQNNFNIYYSTFVDDIDFEKIIRDDLCKTKEKRQIVYICAHGNKNTIGGGNADNILETISDLRRDNRRPIEGIIVGSCLVGAGFAFSLEVATKERGVNWIFGYNVSIGWMESVFIEMAIIEQLSYVKDSNYIDNFQSIIDVFMSALDKFDPDWKIGYSSPKKNEPDVALKDAIVLHIRKKNDTNPAGNISNLLF